MWDQNFSNLDVQTLISLPMTELTELGLTKAFVMISNWKNLPSLVLFQIFQRFNPYSAGIDFNRQNLTSVKSISAL